MMTRANLLAFPPYFESWFRAADFGESNIRSKVKCSQGTSYHVDVKYSVYKGLCVPNILFQFHTLETNFTPSCMYCELPRRIRASPRATGPLSSASTSAVYFLVGAFPSLMKPSNDHWKNLDGGKDPLTARTA